MKFLLSTFLLLLSFENVFSQSNVTFKGFELLDSVVYKPNEQGITLSENGKIMAMKINDRFYFFSHTFPDSIEKFGKVLEKIENEKAINKIIQFGTKTIINNFYGYTIISPPEYNQFYIKSDFYKDSFGNPIYPDDMMSERRIFNNTYYTNAMPYFKNYKSYKSVRKNNGKSPEVIALQFENNKLNLSKEYGIRDPENLKRLSISHQLRSYFDIDTLQKRVISGSRCEPEIEVYSMDGDSLFSFGEVGKFITVDSVINGPNTQRMDVYSFSAVASYRYCTYNAREKILLRFYNDGVLMNFHPDSLKINSTKEKGGCFVDLYLDEVSRTSPRPFFAFQIYDMNTNPPSLIDDVKEEGKLGGMHRAYFDADGFLVRYTYLFEQGIITKFRYKLLMEK